MQLLKKSTYKWAHTVQTCGSRVNCTYQCKKDKQIFVRWQDVAHIVWFWLVMREAERTVSAPVCWTWTLCLCYFFYFQSNSGFIKIILTLVSFLAYRVERCFFMHTDCWHLDVRTCLLGSNSLSWRMNCHFTFSICCSQGDMFVFSEQDKS